MTNIGATATRPNAMEVWGDRARTYGTWLAIAGVAFLLGMFVFAPMRSSAQPSNLPASYLALPTGIVSLTAADGSGALLPVRIADTSQGRMTGFRDVGEIALANQFLLYAQNRQTSGRSSYSLEKVRVPLEFAAIDGEGNVVAIAASTLGMERITIADPHRWLLAAKSGTFSHYGIAPGTKIDTESIRKINLSRTAGGLGPARTLSGPPGLGGPDPVSDRPALIQWKAAGASASPPLPGRCSPPARRRTGR